LQCYWPLCEEHRNEMACTAGGAPTVPTRRIRRPTRPGLSIWRRLVLAFTRLRFSFR
jgi:hypothetical protein